jgi:putative addiction module killer protein
LKEIRRSARYRDWFVSLRDGAIRARISVRIRRLAEGNPGTHRSLSRGLRELKLDIGPGFRIYYVEIGQTVILLLAGGDKSTQQQDIRIAWSMMDDIHEEY